MNPAPPIKAKPGSQRHLALLTCDSWLRERNADEKGFLTEADPNHFTERRLPVGIGHPKNRILGDGPKSESSAITVVSVALTKAIIPKMTRGLQCLSVIAHIAILNA